MGLCDTQSYSFSCCEKTTFPTMMMEADYWSGAGFYLVFETGRRRQEI